MIRQVHFAYRPGGRGFIGAHTTYEVEAAADAVTITPRLAESSTAPAGLTLATTAIERGTTALISGAPRVTVGKDGGLEIDRGGVKEHLRNGEDGVEESWSFAERPEGSGDLQVRLRVSGMAYAGSSPHGLHFADPISQAGVRYGLATWVDASERRTPVEVAYEDGELLLRVPSAVIDDSAYPAVLDPVLGPELGMDAPIYLPASYTQQTPSVASNGNDYLVVWSDSRGPSTSNDIYAARVSSAGELLDTVGIGVVMVDRSQIRPSAAFDGTNYLVVWEDDRNSATTQRDIYGARVSPSGVVLDVDGFPISTSTYAQLAPQVTFNGTDYLVVWEDGRAAGPYDIYGARVGTDGVVKDPNGIPICTAPNDQLKPHVASNGDDFLVTWDDQRAGAIGIYRARLAADGAVKDPNGTAIAVQTTGAALRYGNSVAYAPLGAPSSPNYLVTWIYANEVQGQRFDATTGAPIEAAPFSIMRRAQTRSTTSVAYARDNGYYFVAYNENPSGSERIHGNWVDGATGVVLNNLSGGIWLDDSNGTYANPSVASNGTSFYAVFRAKSSGPIWGRQVAGPNEPAAAAMMLGMAANRQEAPAVDYDGSQWLVSWIDRRYAVGRSVFAVRIDSSGQVIDPAGIEVTRHVGQENKLTISHDAENFFVMWPDYRSGVSYDIYGSRIARESGAVLDPAGLPISTATNAQTHPTVAFDGTNYLVAWADQRSSGYNIYGARVQPSGVPIEAGGFPIANYNNWQQNPSVAFDGTNFLVVFDDSNVSTTVDIRGVRVTTAGTILDPTGFTISNATGAQTRPSVASNGSGWFAAWSDDRTTTRRIYGARITSAGTVQDPSGIPIGLKSTPFDYPAVAWDGKLFITAYVNTSDRQLYASWVRPDGFLFFLGGYPVSQPQVSNLVPGLAGNGAGTSLLTYSRFEPAAPYGNSRAWARTLSLGGANGNACTAATDCASGYCVDGVCCDAACGDGAANDCQACSVEAGAAVSGACGPVQAGAVCRSANGSCDVAEACDGTALACPVDGFVKAGTQCRPAGVCDPAESCSGLSATCPADAKAADGTTCDDGLACTKSDACKTGVCAGTAVVCNQPAVCHGAGTCNPGTGACDYPPLDGTACNDADACTKTDVCQVGVCVGSEAVVCEPLDECHVAGECDPTTGCSQPVALDGTPCASGTCTNGVCGTTTSTSTSTSTTSTSTSTTSTSTSSSTTTSSGTGGAGGGVTGAGGATTGTGGVETGTGPATSGAGAGGEPDTGGGPLAGDGGDPGGCGCRVGAERSATAAWPLAIIGLGVLVRRRRRPFACSGNAG